MFSRNVLRNKVPRCAFPLFRSRADVQFNLLNINMESRGPPMRSIAQREGMLKTGAHFSTSNNFRARPPVLEITNADIYPYGSPTNDPREALLTHFSWVIKDGDENIGPDCWAIIGSVSSSRQDLIRTVLRQWRFDPPDSVKHPFLDTLNQSRLPGATDLSPEEVIKVVSFKTRLATSTPGANSGDFQDYTSRYYAIRDEDQLTLRQHLEDGILEASAERLEEVASLMQLEDLMDLPLVTLSNGQTRRSRIAKALMSGRGGAGPEILILEEPYTGLDVPSRQYLTTVLTNLHTSRSPRIVLALRSQDEIPPFVTHAVVLSTEEGRGSHRIIAQGPIESVRSALPPPAEKPSASNIEKASYKKREDGKKIVNMKDVNVRYGDRHVLKQIDWTVKEGERWSLSGANGSGKSTLLSLVLGDHPRSFSEEVELFGKPRIKQATSQIQSQIGHVSPEIFNAFPRRLGSSGLTVLDSIVTGFESIFSYRAITSAQSEAIESLVKDFDYPELLTADFMSKLFAELSPGEQSLVLLLRALAKRPALVVADEPFAGMDSTMLQKSRRFLDTQLRDDQALIMISHYEEELPENISHRLRMEDGRAIEH